MALPLLALVPLRRGASLSLSLSFLSYALADAQLPSQCAAEFQLLLRQHPPQTSSRGAASLYLCHLHNLVNARLGKDEYDCGTNLRDVYDCGCGDEEEKEREAQRAKKNKKVKDEEKRSSEEVSAALVDEAAGARRDPATGLELVGG